MRRSDDNRAIVHLVAVLLTITALVTGCEERASQGDSADPAASATLSVKAPTSSSHDIAIISIDFDPPLTIENIATVPIDKFHLLVAIDNKGDIAEKDLRIVARLMDESEQNVTQSQTHTIGSLAPGEARVVTFSDFKPTSDSNSHLIRVEVQKPNGEVINADSSRFSLIRPR